MSPGFEKRLLDQGFTTVRKRLNFSVNPQKLSIFYRSFFEPKWSPGIQVVLLYKSSVFGCFSMCTVNRRISMVLVSIETLLQKNVCISNLFPPLLSCLHEWFKVNTFVLVSTTSVKYPLPDFSFQHLIEYTHSLCFIFGTCSQPLCVVSQEFHIF